MSVVTDPDLTGIPEGGGASDGSFTLAASATPATNGDAVLERTSNTLVTLKLKGDDGTVRSVGLGPLE